uniref:ERAP1-like C-terminal domain-containing protein n=1 Tax=Photinus pyralis TaxID=7054 RepID=A0A1Y1JVA9_PHOPY
MWLKEKSVIFYPNASINCILVNNQQTGYYRVNYDIRIWRSLTRRLTNNRLDVHVSNRAQLLDDAFELAHFNYIPYDIPLGLSLYLRREVESLPFLAFFNNIEKVKLYLESLGKEEMFKNYIKNLLEDLYRSLGFEETELDEYLNKHSRISIITWACNLNLFNCRDQALKAVRSWLSNGTKIAINLEVPIMCGAMQMAPVDDWKMLYAKYESIPDGERKWKLLTGLGCTSHKMFLEKYLAPLKVTPIISFW